MNKAIQLVNGMKSKRHQLNKLSEIKTKRERESTLSIYRKEGLCCGVVDKEDELGYDAMNRLMREQRQSNSGTETLMLRTWSF